MLTSTQEKTDLHRPVSLHFERRIEKETPLGLLYSGGIDSSILLALLLKKGYRVCPFYIRSGLCWQIAELAEAKKFLESQKNSLLEPLVEISLPLDDLYKGHWSLTGKGVPDEKTPDEAVYLPGRNGLLILKAALWCQLNNIAHLAIATLQTSPFDDSTEDYFSLIEATMNHGQEENLSLHRPLAKMNKREVMLQGKALQLKNTFSCLSPQQNLHCGHCNKCAERIAAFQETGQPDPTRYATPPMEL